MLVKKKSGKIQIDLDGPDGNAFCLMGTTQNILKQIGFTKEEIENVIGEMTSGDYINLLKVMESKVGSVVEFHTDNSEYIKAFKSWNK